MNRLPTAILFDWDGTIVDSLGAVHVALNEAAQPIGWPQITWQQTHESTIYGRRAVEEVFGINDPLQGEQFWKIFCNSYFHGEGTCTTTLGAVELIGQLPANIPLGIVTNGQRTHIKSQINHLNLQNRFASIVCVDEAPRNKPAPDPALMALEIMGIAPSRDVWFIGDTRGDVECAHAAGLTSIMLAPAPPACNPHHHFADCSLIHAHLQKLLPHAA